MLGLSFCPLTVRIHQLFTFVSLLEFTYTWTCYHKLNRYEFTNEAGSLFWDSNRIKHLKVELFIYFLWFLVKHISAASVALETNLMNRQKDNG